MDKIEFSVIAEDSANIKIQNKHYKNQNQRFNRSIILKSVISINRIIFYA